MVFLFLRSASPKVAEIKWGLFRRELDENNIAKVEVNGMRLSGEFRSISEGGKGPPIDPDGKADKAGTLPRLPEKFVTVVPPQVMDSASLDDMLLKKLGTNYGATEPRDSSAYMLGVYLLVTILLFAGVWFMFRRTRDQMLGGGLLAGFAKSPAKRYQTGDKPITFEDVAGLEGVKGELEEIVEFLKNPTKFQRLGGRVPKGVLLMGPPGTGKTLLGLRGGGRGGGPFLFDQWLGIHSDVCRSGGKPCSRHVLDGQGKLPFDPFHR